MTCIVIVVCFLLLPVATSPVRAIQYRVSVIIAEGALEPNSVSVGTGFGVDRWRFSGGACILLSFGLMRGVAKVRLSAS